jgi:small subunit ribosomal protein S17
MMATPSTPKTTSADAQPAREESRRKVRTGIVTSNKMQKTIVVKVQRFVRHPQYNRVIKQAGSFKAHDETNSAAIGDLVRIMETRPLSKDKRWRLVEILERASTAPPVPGTEEPAKGERPATEPGQ